jgi:hypothetical protein
MRPVEQILGFHPTGMRLLRQKDPCLEVCPESETPQGPTTPASVRRLWAYPRKNSPVGLWARPPSDVNARILHSCNLESPHRSRPSFDEIRLRAAPRADPAAQQPSFMT